MSTPRTPLWLRLAEYAVDHAAPGGALFLEPGALRDALGETDRSNVRRALGRAIAAGWLDPRSSTRVLLVVPAKRRVSVSR